MFIDPGAGLGWMHEQHVCAAGLAPKAGTETLCITGAAHSSVPPTMAPRLTSSRREMPDLVSMPSSAISSPSSTVDIDGTTRDRDHVRRKSENRVRRG